jgi:hypothetical protein
MAAMMVKVGGTLVQCTLKPVKDVMWIRQEHSLSEN